MQKRLLRMVRSVVERGVHGSRVKRRLPNGVQFYVSPDSQLKYLGRDFDTDLARRHVTEDSVVWDIGANCGVLAFNSARARQIVAVEADPFLCNLIQDSSAMNGVDVIVVTAAAYSECGLAEFEIAKRGRASNHLASVKGSTQSSGARGRIVVPTIALDSLLDRVLPPTLMKIDVEGAEVSVLKGASRILSEVRPLLYIESGDETRDECGQILARAGYTMTEGAEMNWLCIPD